MGSGESLGTATLTLATNNKPLNAGMAAAHASVLGRFSKMGKMIPTLLGGGLVLAAAGVAVFAAKSITAYKDFEAAMTKSVSIMGDITVDEYERMEHAAREVGRVTQFTAEQAAEAYFYLASAGLDAAQAIAAMPAVAEFAQAGAFDLATATDLLTDAQSALGLKSADAAENLENLVAVSDVLVGANKLANASVEQFSTSLTTKAGAAAKVLGKDVQEASAVLGAFADQGVKGQLAGNALSIVWRDLQTAALNNKKAFKEQGVAVFDTAGEFRHTADVVTDLEKALDGMSDKQVKSTLTQLGFQDRSQSFLLTLLGTSDAIKGYDAALRDADGTTKEVADKQMKGLEGAMALVGGETAELSFKMGKILVPIVEDAARALASFLAALNTGAGTVGKVTKVLGEVLGTAFTLAANIVSTMVGGIIESLQGLMDIFAGLSEVVLGVLTLDFERAWEGIKRIVKGATRFILGTLKMANAVMIAAVKTAMGKYGDKIKEGFRAAVDFVKTIPGKIGAALASTPGLLAAAANAAWRKYKDAMALQFKIVRALVVGLPPKIVSALGDLGKLLFGAGRAIVQGAIDGIRSQAGAILATIKDVITGPIPGFAKKALGISSPSKVMRKIGENIVDGLNLGIEGNPVQRLSIPGIGNSPSNIYGGGLALAGVASTGTETARAQTGAGGSAINIEHFHGEGLDEGALAARFAWQITTKVPVG